MIKKVICTVALLLPGLAYSANPNANLTGQITPAQSDPTVPAGAQAAGFTTLAANWDFTANTMCIAGSCVPASPLSNWLDCAGASNPQWWELGNCVDTTIITDGGVGTLDLRFNIANWPGQNSNTMQTANRTNTSTSMAFPTGIYVEIKSRNPTYVGTCNSSAPSCSQNDFFGWSTANNTSSPFVEWDFIEMYGQATVNGGIAHNWNGANGGDQLSTREPGSVPGYDPTIYHIYGTRVTTDGAGNVALCFYLDNTILTPCGSDSLLSPTPLPHDFFSLETGPYTFPNNFLQNSHYYIQWIRVWECAGWATGQCNGTMLTGAP